MAQSEGVFGAAFWDFELCPPPPGISGAVFVNKIRDEMCSRNATYFSLFKVYTTPATPIPQPFKTELLNSGAQICEGDGSTADKIRRTVDILTWGLTARHPAAIIFISSDPDFASLISALRNANCDVSLLLHPDTRSSSLLDYAADVLEWNQVFNLEQGNHPAGESSIDATPDDRGMTTPPHQTDPGPLQAPRTTELSAPNHPATTHQDPLLSPLPQTEPGEPPQQVSGSGSSGTDEDQVSGNNQAAGEQSTQQATTPDPPPRNFQLFKHLVDVLEELKNKTSQEWHPWGTVSNMLVDRDPDVCKKLDSRSRWAEFNL
ncbi:hypothetical protein FRC01_009722 [Tulasnella sp. 417]|nr:hypothetical protein FRC01_009722 [Tulasnella sp. 417]